MLILTIKATTTDQEIENAMRYVDMQKEAKERRDDAAAVLAEQGDQAVLELHDIDGVDVLYSPTFGYALVNEVSPGIGDSLLIENGEAGSPEHAARIWAEEGDE
jgi:hypothetical protein